MILKDLSFSDPLRNILYDDVLLRLAEDGTGGEVLRFWESPVHFVVLGLVGKVHEDVDENAVRRDSIALLRRSSGGGTVLQGPGSLNYTLILSRDLRPDIADLRKSYEYILSRVCRALKIIGIKAVFLPISDIALAGSLKKVSGNAQKRSKKYILHHGTILYNLDIALASRYLRMPRSVPEYRRGRDHADFIANVPASPVEIKRAVCDVFEVNPDVQGISEVEQRLLDQMTICSEKNISL